MLQNLVSKVKEEFVSSACRYIEGFWEWNETFVCLKKKKKVSCSLPVLMYGNIFDTNLMQILV